MSTENSRTGNRNNVTGGSESLSREFAKEISNHPELKDSAKKHFMRYNNNNKTATTFNRFMRGDVVKSKTANEALARVMEEIRTGKLESEIESEKHVNAEKPTRDVDKGEDAKSDVSDVSDVSAVTDGEGVDPYEFLRLGVKQTEEEEKEDAEVKSEPESVIPKREKVTTVTLSKDSSWIVVDIKGEVSLRDRFSENGAKNENVKVKREWEETRISIRNHVGVNDAFDSHVNPLERNFLESLETSRQIYSAMDNFLCVNSMVVRREIVKKFMLSRLSKKYDEETNRSDSNGSSGSGSSSRLRVIDTGSLRRYRKGSKHGKLHSTEVNAPVNGDEKNVKTPTYMFLSEMKKDAKWRHMKPDDPILRSRLYKMFSAEAEKHAREPEPIEHKKERVVYGFIYNYRFNDGKEAEYIKSMLAKDCSDAIQRDENGKGYYVSYGYIGKTKNGIVSRWRDRNTAHCRQADIGRSILMGMNKNVSNKEKKDDKNAKSELLKGIQLVDWILACEPDNCVVMVLSSVRKTGSETEKELDDKLGELETMLISKYEMESTFGLNMKP